MRFDLITIFPHILDSYFGESILKRAQKRRLIKIVMHNLRDFTSDKHKKVDDSPYGGGPGMVLQVAPIYRAVQFAKSKIKKLVLSSSKDKKTCPELVEGSKVRTILFSTRGKKFDAAMARRLAKYDQLILICGRYEGVDERVAKFIADEEVSMGDFVLSGGELPAAVLTEAVARFIPGVLGKYESLEDIKGSYPVYTRPEIFQPHPTLLAPKSKGRDSGWKVPASLLSGNHKKIAEWRARSH